LANFFTFQDYHAKGQVASDSLSGPGQKHLTFFEIGCGKNCYKWANFDLKVEKILGKRLKNGLQVGRNPILFFKCFCPASNALPLAYSPVWRQNKKIKHSGGIL
jgi:hypothetical protein